MVASFQEARAAMFRLYGEGDYRAALGVIVDAKPRFPEWQGDILFWSMCLHSMVGEERASLAAFREGLDAGHFYGAEALADSDLDALRQTAEFRELEARSLEMAAGAGSTDEPIVISPPEGVAHRGLLGFMHGAGANPMHHEEYWAPVAATGWTVAILRGNAVFTSDRVAWSFDGGPKRVIRHVSSLMNTAGHQTLVLAGFSQGAGLACYLDQTGALDPAGLLLLAPSFRYFGMPLHLEGRRRTPMWVSIGSQDRELDVVSGFVDHCQQCGVRARLDVHADLGHDYPPDMVTLVTNAAAWFADAGP